MGIINKVNKIIEDMSDRIEQRGSAGDLLKFLDDTKKEQLADQLQEQWKHQDKGIENGNSPPLSDEEKDERYHMKEAIAKMKNQGFDRKTGEIIESNQEKKQVFSRLNAKNPV